MRTAGVLIALYLCALPAFVMCCIASTVNLFRKNTKTPASGRTVMLTGGKMTKCLQLARLFAANGDRVIVTATPLYKYCGSRYSNRVDQFVLIPEITDDGKAHMDALIQVATDFSVDLFVPVSSPKSAYYEALAKPNFPPTTKVFQPDADVIATLDDKHQFVALAESYGLSVPESHDIRSVNDLLNYEWPSGKQYILKKIDYDPVYRLDLRPLPHQGWEERVRQYPISADEPWVLQEFITGREICTHTTTQDGNMNLYICCDSSPFQVNYKMLDLPQVYDWVESFVSKLGATGQLSFDFFVQDDGRVVPIECNPRTHSAITLMHNQPRTAEAYYADSQVALKPLEHAGHTYWLYHELHRLFTAGCWSKFRSVVHTIWTGKEAVWNWKDPWPFFWNNHVSIPYQLLQVRSKGQPWTRIDFNIGKIIVPGGD